MSTSPDNDDDDDDDEVLMLSDVDASLQSLSLKHHLAVRSVGLIFAPFFVRILVVSEFAEIRIIRNLLLSINK